MRKKIPNVPINCYPRQCTNWCTAGVPNHHPPPQPGSPRVLKGNSPELHLLSHPTLHLCSGQKWSLVLETVGTAGVQDMKSSVCASISYMIERAWLKSQTISWFKSWGTSFFKWRFHSTGTKLLIDGNFIDVNFPVGLYFKGTLKTFLCNIDAWFPSFPAFSLLSPFLSLFLQNSES